MFVALQNKVCCAYILNSSGRWQLVCNNPTNVSSANPPISILNHFILGLALVLTDGGSCACSVAVAGLMFDTYVRYASFYFDIQIPGALPFPAGTVISGINFVPGQIAQCVGRFPYPNPTPYRLPSTGQQLFTPPNGGKCAGQFSRFYQVRVAEVGDAAYASSL